MGAKKEIRRYFITIYNFVQLGMYKCVPMCQISSLRDILASFVTFAIQNGVKLFMKEKSFLMYPHFHEMVKAKTI